MSNDGYDVGFVNFHESLPIEIINIISQYISDGITWKSFIFTCKMFYSLNSDAKVDRFSDHMSTLSKLYVNSKKFDHSRAKVIDVIQLLNSGVITLDRCFRFTDEIVEQLVSSGYVETMNWRIISYSKGVTIDFALEHKCWPWDWCILTHKISMEHYINNPDIPWSRRNLSIKKWLTIEMLLDDLKKSSDITHTWGPHDWEWPSLTANFVRRVDLLDYMYLPWNVGVINKYLPYHEVIKYPERGGRTTVAPLIERPELYENSYWTWWMLSSNPSITIEILLDNLDKDWNWSALSETINLTDEILSDKRLKLDWEFISGNPSLTSSMIAKYIDKLDIDMLSSSSDNITDEIVINNPDKGWDWSEMDISVRIVKCFPNVDWGSLGVDKLGIFLDSVVKTYPCFTEYYADLGHLNLNIANIASRFPNITLSEIDRLIESGCHFDMQYLSMKLDPKIILSNKDRGWMWNEFSRRYDVTIEMIDSNSDIDWDWRAISMKNKMTWRFVQKYLHKGMDLSLINIH